MEHKNESVINETINTEINSVDIMPDSAISVPERDSYGYDWDGMLPLLESRAIELFEQDYQIYRLYSDGTEAAVDKREEIMEHMGIFGIEADDWAASREYAETVKASLISKASKETERGNETNAETAYSQGYGDFLREHISNQARYGYLSEYDEKILNDSLDSIVKQMIDIENKFEKGMPLDVETDTVDRLFQEILTKAREEQEKPFTDTVTERKSPDAPRNNRPTPENREKPSILARVEENKKVIAGKEPKDNAPKRGNSKEV